jgi:protein-tyrosine phosphatase
MLVMAPTDDGPQGLRNLRDVGGVRTVDGRWVARGRLYRSDAPIAGDSSPALEPWPPRTVVDLRAPGEALASDHPLAAAGATVVDVPLFGELAPGALQAGEEAQAPDLPTIYRRVLDSSAHNLGRVVEIVANSPGPVLLHCAAGKDRTGVATAVTLSAVGVGPDAIIADYLLTEESLDGLVERLALGWSDARRDELLHTLTATRPDLMQAPAAAIEAVLATLGSWPGGTPAWLGDHGVSSETLAALRHRLTTSTPGG